MDELLNPIRQFAAAANETARRHLISALHKLAYSLESADETLHRYGSMVRLPQRFVVLRELMGLI